MAEGYVPLNQGHFQTEAGIAELNRMMRQIYDLLPGDGDTVRIYKGYGSPENSISAGIGSIYQRLDGSTNTTLYVKESGTAATGWIAK